jgi:hypothetical protein
MFEQVWSFEQETPFTGGRGGLDKEIAGILLTLH